MTWRRAEDSGVREGLGRTGLPSSLSLRSPGHLGDSAFLAVLPLLVDGGGRVDFKSLRLDIGGLGMLPHPLSWLVFCLGDAWSLVWASVSPFVRKTLAASDPCPATVAGSPGESRLVRGCVGRVPLTVHWGAGLVDHPVALQDTVGELRGFPGHVH